MKKLNFQVFKKTVLMVSMLCFACGGDRPAVIDAPPDGAPLAVDCPTYCAEIQASCTGANAQYVDGEHCMAACLAFTVGTSTADDMAGNTLGCRIYHAGLPAMAEPGAHCAHAGPAGKALTAMSQEGCSGGDVCESFCAIQIKACGSLEAPLPGSPRDATNNPLYRYRSMTSCVTACAAFDKTHPYSTTAAGDSLACRLVHATNAAIAVMPNAVEECQYTGMPARGPCAGTPTP